MAICSTLVHHFISSTYSHTCCLEDQGRVSLLCVHSSQETAIDQRSPPPSSTSGLTRYSCQARNSAYFIPQKYRIVPKKFAEHKFHCFRGFDSNRKILPCACLRMRMIHAPQNLCSLSPICENFVPRKFVYVIARAERYKVYHITIDIDQNITITMFITIIA